MAVVVRYFNINIHEGVFLFLCRAKPLMAACERPKLRIGIDFGGVLSVHEKNQPPPTHKNDGDHVRTAIDMPGAIDALHRLHSAGHELHLISFCGFPRAVETQKALIKADLAKLFTTINFVRKRNWKGYVCDELGIHVMIDDRQDVLKAVKTDTAGRTHCLRFENGWVAVLEDLDDLMDNNSKSLTDRVPYHSTIVAPMNDWRTVLLHPIRTLQC